MIGFDNSNKQTLGTTEAKYMWVYIIFPFIGAVLAAVFYMFHKYIENNENKQAEPMQFLPSTQEPLNS